LIQYVAHAILFLRATPLHGQEEVDVINAMKFHRWKFSGFMRSYWDFYFGYGLLAILWGLIEIVLLWDLARLSHTPGVHMSPFIGLLLFANVAHAILTMRYFFLQPVIFDFLIGVVLLLALVLR
jgi:hypothetical protein